MQEYASTSQTPPSKNSCHDSKSFFKHPPQNPTCKSMPQLHSLPSPRLLVTIPSHFLNLPPQNPTCKSMPQLHRLPPPRILVTIPSHFLNLPPKILRARVCLNFTASPLQDFSPPKTLHATVCFNFTASPLQAFLSRFQAIF